VSSQLSDRGEEHTMPVVVGSLCSDPYAFVPLRGHDQWGRSEGERERDGTIESRA
jgi:hypothetical protein